MIIDVLFSSCARPGLLEASVHSTKENLISKNHTFRWVIVEDLVDDLERRVVGRQWIEENANLFDEVVFSDVPAVVDKHWQKALKLCKSSIHIRGEDDTNYLMKIDIDPIVDVVMHNKDIIEVIFCRNIGGKINPLNNPRKVDIEGLDLTHTRLMSTSVGIYNTSLVMKLLDEVGWDSVLSESGVLTPACDKLGFRRFVLGHDQQHYIHAGASKKYRKGKWK